MNESTPQFSNDQHAAFMSKQGEALWKCFNSKLGNKLSNCQHIESLLTFRKLLRNVLVFLKTRFQSDSAELSSQH